VRGGARHAVQHLQWPGKIELGNIREQDETDIHGARSPCSFAAVIEE
jgi:hypothetical protein